jgi:GntR family transcriptional regulator, sialic acid-inducible nan operon repressor
MPGLDTATTRLAPGRAADAIIARLEQQIVSGALADAKPLPPERDLMEQFGTSRTVIREAIATLASRGLIESRPRFRPVVRKPDYGTALYAVGGVVRHLLGELKGVKNLYASRLFIERGLVRDAATSASKDDIAELRAALAANREAIPDSQAFYRTDTAFHAVLYRIPRNPIFPAIHLGYTAWLAPQWDKMERSRARNEISYHGHQAMLDGILSRDPAAAEEALVSHLDAAWRHVEATFEFDAP